MTARLLWPVHLLWERLTGRCAECRLGVLKPVQRGTVLACDVCGRSRKP